MGSGDTWPAVDLAKVQFNQTGPRQFTSTQVVVKRQRAAAAGRHLRRRGSGCDRRAAAARVRSALPAGHRRRIFFGFADVATDGDLRARLRGGRPERQCGSRNAEAGSQLSWRSSIRRVTTVCLPLGPGQTPVTETWELVQLSTENHNFHMHQTRFIERTGTHGEHHPGQLPAGRGRARRDHCGSGHQQSERRLHGRQWRSGHCVSPPVVMDIPFAQLGEFVYHCHILEHEDGGMMARILVVPSPG